MWPRKKHFWQLQKCMGHQEKKILLCIKNMMWLNHHHNVYVYIYASIFSFRIPKAFFSKVLWVISQQLSVLGSKRSKALFPPVNVFLSIGEGKMSIFVGTHDEGFNFLQREKVWHVSCSFGKESFLYYVALWMKTWILLLLTMLDAVCCFVCCIRWAYQDLLNCEQV